MTKKEKAVLMQDMIARWHESGQSRGVSGSTNSGALAQKLAKVYSKAGISNTGKAENFPVLASPGFSAKAG
jgi:hypothetical protein